MNRRIALALLVSGIAVAGLSTTAGATTPEERSTICVDLRGARPPIPPSICIGWDDATAR